jgi:hypothetical protein
MKKLVILGLLALGFTLKPNLAAAEQATSVISVMRSSMSCQGFSISNSAGTSVIVSTSTGYYFVGVGNEDASSNLFCNELSGVTTSGSARGFKLTPGQFVLWTLTPGMNWYCISGGGSSTNAMVCRGY